MAVFYRKAARAGNGEARGAGRDVTVRTAINRVLRLASTPVRRGAGRGRVVIQAYRGYGSPTRVLMVGRVFSQPGFRSAAGPYSLWRNTVDLFRRFLRSGLRRAMLRARVNGEAFEVETDRDGYFRIDQALARPLPGNRRWHPVDLELVRVRARPARDPAASRGAVYVPPPAARFAVVSDIDDTVVYTGVANRLAMFWRLFFKSAGNRTAFPGVPEFYRALHAGPSGGEGNPMLYVSRGPWVIYELLEAFFRDRDIPHGPILFLRDWGMTLQTPLPPPAADHKASLIRDMLAVYPDLPFVLIGDSGQRDPEIYARIVHEHPGRVRAVYIRDVSRTSEREAAIAALACELADQGVRLVLTADTAAMARDAAEAGLIAGDAPARVAKDAEAEAKSAAT